MWIGDGANSGVDAVAKSETVLSIGPEAQPHEGSSCRPGINDRNTRSPETQGEPGQSHRRSQRDEDPHPVEM